MRVCITYSATRKDQMPDTYQATAIFDSSDDCYYDVNVTLLNRKYNLWNIEFLTALTTLTTEKLIGKARKVTIFYGNEMIATATSILDELTAETQKLGLYDL